MLIAERFATFLADPASRDEAASVASPNDMLEHADLAPVRADADELHAALGALLFNSFLGDRARRYLVL